MNKASRLMNKFLGKGRTNKDKTLVWSANIQAAVDHEVPAAAH